MKTTFEVVRIHGSATFKCCECGKRLTRSRQFWQTLNPWNKNESGHPKSREEIYAELRAQQREWERSEILCKVCSDDMEPT